MFREKHWTLGQIEHLLPGIHETLSPSLGLTGSGGLIPACYNKRNKKENCSIREHHTSSHFSFWNMFFESKFAFWRSPTSNRVGFLIHFILLWSSYKVFEKILVRNLDFFNQSRKTVPIYRGYFEMDQLQNGSKRFWQNLDPVNQKIRDGSKFEEFNSISPIKHVIQILSHLKIPRVTGRVCKWIKISTCSKYRSA